MKTPIKILLLFLAICACVAAVLIFQKTIVSPPTKLDYPDQYEAYLNQKILEYKGETGNLEPGYILVMDLLERMDLENVINGEKKSKGTVDFIAVYAPKFSDWAFDKFRSPVWKSEDINFISKRIKTLNELPVPENPALNDPNKSNFSTLEGIISSYKDAESLSRQTSFSGWQSSEEKIRKAKNFEQDAYLRNNNALMKSLKELPEKLARSHFNTLKRDVELLSYYHGVSQESYDHNSSDVVRKMDEFESRIYNVYGNNKVTRNIKDRELPRLREEANTYINRAEKYFDYES